MRTTIRLDPKLLAQAKRHALDTGRTLTAVIEDALKQALARQTPPSRRSRVRLSTYGGDGLQAGVDLDDSADLLDRMNDR